MKERVAVASASKGDCTVKIACTLYSVVALAVIPDLSLVGKEILNDTRLAMTDHSMQNAWDNSSVWSCASSSAWRQRR